MVGIYTTMKYVFDIRDEDRFWCTADPGWITGHSYLVYGPLLNGATIFMYEGAPTYPYPNRWWQMIEEYGLTILYTAPTAIRGLMRFGEAWANRHDLSTLRLLGSVGDTNLILKPGNGTILLSVKKDARLWNTLVADGNRNVYDYSCSFMPLKPGSRNLNIPGTSHGCLS